MWINCNEKVPRISAGHNESEICLVISTGRQEYNLASYCIESKEIKRPHWTDCDFRECKEIDYWMELPSPPIVNELNKPLPHSMEAEKCVLGGLLLDSSKIEKIVVLLPSSDYFYSELHQAIYMEMLRQSCNKKPIDVLTINENLKSKYKLKDMIGIESYIFNLAKETSSAANIISYADIIKERYLLRNLISANKVNPNIKNASDKEQELLSLMLENQRIINEFMALLNKENVDIFAGVE